jgi:diacylglycerol O-acyltransferase / wax synthase
MALSFSGDRLTAEDAVFLYVETNDAPLHIGSVSIFDGPIPFDACVKYIASRLPLIPRYQQRVVTPPFHFGHPTWETDPNFDIRNHVHHVQLKRGSESDLRAFAGKLFSQVMDRNRPLWDMTLVDGLNGGRSALISRVHHCLVDGVSGVGLMNIMLDPALQADNRKRKARRAPPLPGAAASLAEAMATSFSEMVGRVLSAQSESLDVAQGLFNDGGLQALDQLRRLAPSLIAPVQPLPFNNRISAARKVAWSEIPMPEVKAIREKLGGTLNDVVLAVLTSAVRRYVELHGVNVRDRLLRLMVPVNLRRQGPDNGLGNRVSMLPVNTPLDVRDPAKLLDQIRQRTEALKNARVADWIHLAATWMGMTPVPLQAAAGPFANLFSVPAFHMVCTNVPGPQVPLYALGCKMLTYYPYVPIGNQMALNCAIQSYNQVLYVGFTADPLVVPDLNRIKQFVDASFRELCHAAGIKKCQNEPKRPRPARQPADPAVQFVAPVNGASAAPAAQTPPPPFVAEIVNQPERPLAAGR